MTKLSFRRCPEAQLRAMIIGLEKVASNGQDDECNQEINIY